MRRFKSIWFGLSVVMLLLAGALVFSTHSGGQDAYAGAAVYGDPSQSDTRALISVDGTDKVTRIVYFSSGSHATGGANTPVASSTFCNIAGTEHKATFRLSGTMAGTAPTLAILWQNSEDKGSNWTSIGTWTTVNATVTPASQSQTFFDQGPIVLMNANTPVTTPAVAYGDCWRVLYTMTGTGAAANFSVSGIDK